MICKDRVVVVTGAGRGLGRAHALAFAAAGARVVVNDLGVAVDGNTPWEGPAADVVAEIERRGGVAVADVGDVTTEEGAAGLVSTAVEAFGRLDVLVNNAGFVRDRMLVNTSEEEWDAVVRVHLKGHFMALKHAGLHWRALTKAGREVNARVVNTTSGAGLLGSVGQANYSSAKAGIVGLTLVASAELSRYGVKVNAIAPSARTRMTEGVFGDSMAVPGDGSFDAMAPENVSPLVVWLGSAECGVTGRVFDVSGGRICVMDAFHFGPTADKGGRWEPEQIGSVVSGLIAEAPAPAPVYGA
jgi:NAD(P)-dependent dehydrogenase (short-subunit alcohol dehydrogenase family)